MGNCPKLEPVAACRILGQLAQMWFTGVMKAHEWVARVTGSASGREIAARLDRPVSTVNRQLSSETPDASLIVAIARTYGASVVDGLLSIGLVEPGDLKSRVIIATLTSATDEELVAEIYRRLQEPDGPHHDAAIMFPEQRPHDAEEQSLPTDDA